MHSGSDFAKRKKKRDAIQPRRRVYIGEVATPGLPIESAGTHAIYFAIRARYALPQTATRARRLRTPQAVQGKSVVFARREQRFGDQRRVINANQSRGKQSETSPLPTRGAAQSSNPPRRNRRREKSLPERLIMAREPRRRREGLIATMSPRSQLAHAVMLRAASSAPRGEQVSAREQRPDEEGLKTNPCRPGTVRTVARLYIYGEKRRSEKLRERCPTNGLCKELGERIKPQPHGESPAV